jgi:hypothetical protein
LNVGSRRGLATCAALALAIAIALGIGCELLVSLDGLDDKKCPVGQKSCKNLKRCVSIFEPDTGCGLPSCGPCPLVHATASCTDMGECAKAGCIPPYGDCDDKVAGCETDLAHDPNNCNGCGIRCDTQNGYPGCSAGNCKTGGCRPGFDDCDGDVKNGCETDTRMNDQHCGACHKPCPSGMTCNQGSCS